MSSSRAAIACVSSLALLTACDLGKVALPVFPSQLVIHGVLTLTDSSQSVLIERTLTGSEPVPNVFPVDPTEPIFSDGGIGERNARVQITTPSGQVIVARELSSYSVRGNGGGVYVFVLHGNTLVPGGTYRLHIETTRGEVADAETTIPMATVVRTGPLVGFNRTTDTLALTWPIDPPAPAYQVRVESPYGAWFAFTDSTRLSLTGTLRNPTDANLSHVFVPGFRQLVIVSAVDANLYDYYRTSNNSFLGVGIVSRVRGAFGVFGSLVTVSRRTVTVIATPTRPIEGQFNLDGGASGDFYGGAADARSITLYVEAAAVRKNQPDAITASFRTRTGFMGSAVGTLTASTLKLVFLKGQSIADTADVFTGELRGDTLDGHFQKGALGKYIRP